MPRGVYVRPKIQKVCALCGADYILRRGGSDTCKRCRKKEKDRAYVRRKKPWLARSPAQQERKRDHDRRYYRKNISRAKDRRRAHYRENHERYLRQAEQRRRARGEQPAGSKASGPEVMFMKMLRQAGVHFVFRSRLEPRVEVDFLFPTLKLVVELQGEHHRTAFRGAERFAQTQRADRRRRKACQRRGLRLFEVPVYGAFKTALKNRTEAALQKTLRRIVRVRPDKTPEMCVWKEPT